MDVAATVTTMLQANTKSDIGMAALKMTLQVGPIGGRPYERSRRVGSVCPATGWHG